MIIRQLKNISNKLVSNSLESGHDDFKNRFLYKLVESDRSVIVVGPRRIGKTTLLEELSKKSAILPAHSENKDTTEFETPTENDSSDDTTISLTTKEITIPKKILFLKFDSLEFAILTPEEWHEISIIIRDLIIEEKSELVLFDEIQSMPNWALFIKDIKDQSNHKLRIVCTGSNSNELISGSEHGIGRYDILFFGVLTFSEIIQKKLYNNPSEREVNITDLKDYIEYNHFPSYTKNEYKAEVPAAIVEKSFSATKKNKTSLFKLFKYIASEPGSQINASKISTKIGVTRKFIDGYLTELQEAQLIFKLPNNHKLSQQQKVFSLIPGAFTLFDATAKFDETMSPEIQGLHFENFVLIQLLSQTRTLGERMNWSYLNDKDKTLPKNEIDFVYQEIYGYEVKRTLPSNPEEYLAIAKKHKIKKLTFIYINGEKKASYVKGGIIFEFLKFDQLANPEVLDSLRGDLDVHR